MIPVVDLRGGRPCPAEGLRAGGGVAGRVRETVADILAAVRAEGDAAVRRHTAALDGYDGEVREVGRQEVTDAVAQLDPALRGALERAADQVRWFHERARPGDWSDVRDGAVMGVRHSPLRRVGAYVPGGLAPLLSTAVMTIVPARVAGVEEVVLASPPDADGRIAPSILAASAIAGGADRIFAIGGAQAVAALAYGTATVPRCDKVVGPGNAYVAEAKQQVAAEGACAIDLLAGTTEVAIIADATADPRHVAADLVAQAEHDPLATAIAITPDPQLAERILAALEDEVAVARHVERIRAALSGQGAILLVDDLDHAVAVADAFAAEHLEVQTRDAQAVADRIRAAGAIFVGGHTPVSLGDYAAGPNHTLPTGGTARFTGGLRTDDFLVPINWVSYDADTLASLAPVVEALGAAEDLPAHARAVRVRLEGG
ncbi:MAG TPA: histidinol dehydrogenase [Egibacteraceae bacterium]|nr:histidinol dehydrogenase [Egibacteraceae bacterium]